MHSTLVVTGVGPYSPQGLVAGPSASARASAMARPATQRHAPLVRATRARSQREARSHPSYHVAAHDTALLGEVWMRSVSVPSAWGQQGAEQRRAREDASAPRPPPGGRPGGFVVRANADQEQERAEQEQERAEGQPSPTGFCRLPAARFVANLALDSTRPGRRCVDPSAMSRHSRDGQARAS